VDDVASDAAERRTAHVLRKEGCQGLHPSKNPRSNKESNKQGEAS